MFNSSSAGIEWITIKKLAEQTGLSVEAIRAQIKKGYISKNYHWVKRAGRIFINTVRYNEWMSGKSPSSIRG